MLFRWDLVVDKDLSKSPAVAGFFVSPTLLGNFLINSVKQKERLMIIGSTTVLWLILIATLMVWDRIRFLTKVFRDPEKYKK